MANEFATGLAPLKFAPIEEAPTKAGEDFGWCIVAPGGDHQWAVAHWNGEGWFATDGLPREPLIWALLPELGPELFDLDGRVGQAGCCPKKMP
jgi:hypothetical protein